MYPQRLVKCRYRKYNDGNRNPEHAASADKGGYGMKIERINDNKIRVFVSFDDLVDRDIDMENFNYNSPETQELFWDLMDQAEEELGFDSSDSQLIIEAMNDTDVGFVITITRMDEEGEFESIHKFIKNRYRRKDLAVRKRLPEMVSGTVIYGFDSLSDLCGACAHIRSFFRGASSAWKCSDRYHLVMEISEGLGIAERQLTGVLDEFGDRVTENRFVEGYLNEYGQCLVQGHAVGALAQLA